MAGRPTELPPDVARAFVDDMKRYFAEKNPIKRDEIAVLQLRSLQAHWKGKLRLDDVRRMFMEMREHLKDR
jgi:hypothetical protein